MTYKYIIRRNGDYYTGCYTGVWWCSEQCRAAREVLAARFTESKTTWLEDV
jgi:hypothetical protein